MFIFSPEVQNAFIGGFFGLLIGSFLNVVVFRLPKIKEQEWQCECAELLGQTPKLECDKSLTLSKPASHCPKCQHKIRWYENIPVFSYLFLKGRCRSCQTRISLRYPLVELTTGILFAICLYRFNLTPSAFVWCAFCAVLLTAALIDLDTQYLFDDFTLPLVWAGLISSSLYLTDVSLKDSLWGAVAGYLSLWTVYWIFKIITGKEGFGFGDFKLLAAFGAWFGWQSLVPIILMSSLIGSFFGIMMMLLKGLKRDQAIPFGPYLAGAGFCIFLFGVQTVQAKINSLVQLII